MEEVMMKKKVLKKRLIAAIMVGALAAGLAGCGSSASDTDSAEDTTSAESEENADAEESSDSTEVTTIVAGTAASPAPYITVDEDNNVTGYDAAVLEEVFNRLDQYELVWEISDLNAALTGLTAGNYQIAVNNFGYTEERAENYYYSYPYDAKPYYFVQRVDDEPLTSFADAAERGYTIECFTGQIATTAVETWNESSSGDQITIEYTEAELAVVYEHIVDGVSDFRIEDAPIYNQLIESYGFELQATELSEEDTAQISSSLSSYFLFPMTEEGAALREEVDAVLKEMYEDGTLTELQDEYLGIDFLPDAEEYESTIN